MDKYCRPHSALSSRYLYMNCPIVIVLYLFFLGCFDFFHFCCAFGARMRNSKTSKSQEYLYNKYLYFLASCITFAPNPFTSWVLVYMGCVDGTPRNSFFLRTQPSKGGFVFFHGVSRTNQVDATTAKKQQHTQTPRQRQWRCHRQ